MSTPEPLELWFEFASTYSYLAIEGAPQLAVPLRYQPFLLGPIFAAQGFRDSPFNLYPVKGQYMWRDMERLCEQANIPLRRPSRFPRSGLGAARLALVGRDESWLPAFLRAVYRANFAEDREISEPGVLAEILQSLGLDADALLEQAGSPAIKQALREQNERAVALGIFGAPTYVVGSELFWGNDRLEQALRFRAQTVGGAAQAALKSPALDPSQVPPRSTSAYPEPFRSRVLPRERRAIGDALGLTKIGANVTTLMPGKESAMRHFHSLEDELVFVLEGEVTLRSDEGDQLLTAGTCAGFPTGARNAHQLLNLSQQPVRYLEMSNRDRADTAEYPDVDLAYSKSPEGKHVFSKKDGSPY